MLRLLAVLVLLGFAPFPAFAQNELERQIWSTVSNSSKAEDLETYLRAFPQGFYAAEARQKLDGLQAGATARGSGPSLVAPEGDLVGPGTTNAAAPTADADGPQVRTAKPVYAPYEPIVVKWSGLKDDVYGTCIAIAKASDPATLTNNTSSYGDDAAGEFSFPGIPAGEYVAGQCDGGKLQWQQPFKVSESALGQSPDYQPKITPGKAEYAPLEPITISLSGIKVDGGILEIRSVGKGEAVWRDWVDLKGERAEESVTGLFPGDYEATFLIGPHDNLFPLARGAFSVIEGTAPAGSAPELRPDKAVFAPFEPIVVHWKNIAADGWIQLAERDGGKEVATDWVYYKWQNKENGSYSFDGLLPGEYEARVLVGPSDNRYVLARANLSVQALAQAQGGGAAATQTAAAAPAMVSGLMQFDDKPATVDKARFAKLAEAVGAAAKQPCRSREAYAWKVQAGEEPRLQAIVKDGMSDLQAQGRAVSQVQVDLPNALVYSAGSAAAGTPLLLAWYLDGQDFYVLVCETD